ncbi:MAG: diphthine--ammonia ligase [Marinilabiliaceae bacterium]|nr:diphthine--ammonia ligase [Marinilabiliaceae bacterium]
MKYIVSWSGGKDCSLAMYKAQQDYGKPVMLLTSIPANVDKTMAHGYRETILKKQAEAMALPIDFMYFEAGAYRDAYVEKLKQIKQEHGITHVVYGDLYLEEHRVWIEEVCREVKLSSLFPAWIKPGDSMELYQEYLVLGFRSVIVNVNKKFLGREWLGRYLNEELANEASGKFCPMAERGEYHSLVVDGPVFSKPLSITKYKVLEEEECFKMDIQEIV